MAVREDHFIWREIVNPAAAKRLMRESRDSRSTQQTNSNRPIALLLASTLTATLNFSRHRPSEHETRRITTSSPHSKRSTSSNDEPTSQNIPERAMDGAAAAVGANQPEGLTGRQICAEDPGERRGRGPSGGAIRMVWS